MRDYLLIYVNGRRHKISGEKCFQSLSDYLRQDLGLVGTKVVCAEGDCGSCTVLVGRIRDGELKFEGLDSCIQYLYQLDCTHVISVEGLKQGNQIHPVQQAMVDAMGSQCGYCTPGFVMSIAAMLETSESLTRLSVQDGLTGNLCRCTGYEQIIEAALSLPKLSKVSSGLKLPSKIFEQKSIVEDFKKHASEPLLCEYDQKLNGATNRVRFFVPCKIKEAIEFKQRHKNVTVVAGGTDISVQINKQYIEPKCVMSLTNLKKLDFIELKNRKVKVGACVTWTKLAEFCHKHLPELSEIISLFASRQIRNAGTLAGNIANASPIADSLPFLHVIEAEIELSGDKGKRWVNINKFYHAYKKTEMRSTELITSIRWDLPDRSDMLKLYKVSKRKDLDISTFTAGILLKVKHGKIKKARLAYGGVGPIVLRLPETERFIEDKPLTKSVFQQAGKIASNEISPISDVRASTSYRSLLSENILIKFFHECCDNYHTKKEAA